MPALPPLVLTPAADRAIRAAAEAAHPAECCGILTWRPGDPASLAVHPLANLADRLHAADPVAHPRDARTAYVVDPREVDRLCREAAAAGRALAAFYHSHPEHGAYFSATDRAAATPFGEPTYPEAAQLVVAVRARRAGEAAAFRWDPVARDYAAITLQLVETGA